jgi:hypothetical protein
MEYVTCEQPTFEPILLLQLRLRNNKTSPKSLAKMQPTLLDLPSGGKIDLTNFVAIVPIEQSDRHQILFSGLSQPLTLDRTDATAVKIFLSTQKSTTSLSEHSYESIELKKVNAVNLMTARIAKHQNMTDEEDAQNAEAFERFKQLIDRDRPLGQKLYS